jgi:hypothetical protein
MASGPYELPAVSPIYVRYARELLVARFGTGAVKLAALALPDVAAFVTARSARLAPASANLVTTALRSFLRYLQLRGLGRAVGRRGRATGS